MDRRNFLGGLAAALAVASLPAPAEATFIKMDLGQAEKRIVSFYIDGIQCDRITMEYSNDNEEWSLVTTTQEGNMLYAEELTLGRYYRFSIQQDDEELYATDFQLIADQRVSSPAEGKFERLLQWIGGDRSYRNSGSMSGRISSATPNFEERRRSSG